MEENKTDEVSTTDAPVAEKPSEDITAQPLEQSETENAVVTNETKAVSDTPALQENGIVPPAGAMAKIYCTHFGLIFSNLAATASVLAVLCLLGSVLTVLIPVLYYIFLIATTVFSIGLSFVAIPNFISWWGFDTSFTSNLANGILSAIPYLCAIALAAAIASTVLLMIDKNNRHWGRFVTAIILSIVAIVVIFIWATGGVK